MLLDNKEAKEDTSDISDASVKKQSILFYSLVTNDKGKPHRKSRRYVLYSQLSVAYYSCCEKAHYYPVGGKKHGRTCIVNHVKFMKNRMNRRTTRSNA